MDVEQLGEPAVGDGLLRICLRAARTRRWCKRRVCRTREEEVGLKVGVDAAKRANKEAPAEDNRRPAARWCEEKARPRAASQAPCRGRGASSAGWDLDARQPPFGGAGRHRVLNAARITLRHCKHHARGAAQTQHRASKARAPAPTERQLAPLLQSDPWRRSRQPKRKRSEGSSSTAARRRRRGTGRALA